LQHVESIQDVAIDPAERAVPARGWWRPDGLAVVGIVVITAFAAGQLFNDGTLIGQDSATQFYPWYDYLGERLRAGEIPGWNPYQFAGAPFAADPQSGWTYLPAMLLFTIFPLPLAVPFFLLLHLTIAGFATYVLARLLKIGVGGALVAAAAYELSGPVMGRSVCCPAALEVATWAPVALVGAELAIRSRNWTYRVIGWTLAGFSVSQGLAAWLGQGGYYLLLALGGFVLFRTVFSPSEPERPMRGRLEDLVMHGGVILSIGFGLAAAGILPRLEYVSRSNVAGGEYSGESAWAAEIGGVTPSMILHRFFDPSLHYPGIAVAILSLSALWLARNWFATKFFAIFGIAALILAAPWTTPLHLLLYTVLPRFEELHKHWPERVALVGYLAFAMLAGAAVDTLRRERLTRRQIAIVIGLPVGSVAALMLVREGGAPIAIGLVAVGLALLVATRMPQVGSVRWAVPVLLSAVIALDLLVGFQGIASQAPYGGFHRVDLDEYYERTEAVAFIERKGEEDPGRYIGFDQSQRAIADGQRVLYRYQFASPSTVELLVNNRGTLHGLEDAQGYNPVQPRRFVEFLTALNGHTQEYHDANIYPDGFTSPLLNLLNIRYVVVPAEIPEDRADLQALMQRLPTIYVDEEVRVLENIQAVPRAWLVHEARQVARGESLPLLANGEVDPLTTALLETTPPKLAPAIDPASESVTILNDDPDRIRLEASTDAPGLLMLSETYDPGWKAYVDGEQVEVLVADHLLRAVPLPAGEHVVELRYEPTSLKIGIAISAVTVLAVVGALVVLGWRAWRRKDIVVGRQA
jgi:hypothetical protein